MSYDVCLKHPETAETLPTENFTDGGTHNIYGTNECDLNITYNYAAVLRMVDEFSIRDLHGKSGKDTAEVLERVRVALGGDLPHPPRPWTDYWAPTPGNALVAINRLLGWAKQHPDGIWEVC